MFSPLKPDNSIKNNFNGQQQKRTFGKIKTRLCFHYRQFVQVLKSHMNAPFQELFNQNVCYVLCYWEQQFFARKISHSE